MMNSRSSEYTWSAVYSSGRAVWRRTQTRNDAGGFLLPEAANCHTVVQDAPVRRNLHQFGSLWWAMPKRKAKKARFTVSLTATQKAALQAIADRSDVSLARVMPEAVKEFLENRRGGRLPLFGRAAIRAVSRPGDRILDPFMGGATGLVEARALGRHCLGTDISSLARFVAQVKTTPLSEARLQEVANWVGSLEGQLNLHQPAENAETPDHPHYQPNVPAPIRTTIRLILLPLPELPPN